MIHGGPLFHGLDLRIEEGREEHPTDGPDLPTRDGGDTVAALDLAHLIGTDEVLMEQNGGGPGPGRGRGHRNAEGIEDRILTLVHVLRQETPVCSLGRHLLEVALVRDLRQA